MAKKNFQYRRPAQNQPKSHILFHKNGSLHDFYIMTLQASINFVWVPFLIGFCSMKIYDWGYVSIHTYLLPRTIGNPHNTQLITILVTLWSELAKFVQKSFKKNHKNWNQINTTFHQKSLSWAIESYFSCWKKVSYFW